MGSMQISNTIQTADRRKKANLSLVNLQGKGTQLVTRNSLVMHLRLSWSRMTMPTSSWNPIRIPQLHPPWQEHVRTRSSLAFVIRGATYSEGLEEYDAGAWRPKSTSEQKPAIAIFGQQIGLYNLSLESR